jgi:hypothetical protein
MKLKNFLVGVAVVSSFFSFAQEETEQERECKRNRFLAGEALKVQNYKEASMYYIKGEKICGGYDKANYDRLLGSLQLAINAETDPAKQIKYIDTVLIYYKKGEGLGFVDQTTAIVRGIYHLQATTPNPQRADTLMKQGIEFEGLKTNEAYVQYYYQNLYVLYANAQADKKSSYKKRLITEYFNLSKLISDAKMSVKTQEIMTQYFNDAVKTCADILPELNEFMRTLPQDKEVKKVTVNNFLSVLETKGCTTAKEYYMLTDTLIAIDPSAGAFIAKAKMLRSQKKYSDAIAAFRQAKSMSNDEAQKEEIEYNIALTQFDMDSYKAAYGTAMGVGGKFKSDALSIAARCVYNTAMSCGVSTFERKCNYYYAAELADRAGDSRTANSARGNFPSGSEIFDEGKAKGQSVSLSCWGVSVTIK